MKKILFLLVSLACLQTAIGQQWKISLGADSKALEYNKKKSLQARYPGFIGHKDGKTYLMCFTDETKSKPYLACFDADLKELGRIDLSSDENATMYGGFVNDKSVDLMMTQKSKSSYTAYKLSYDPSTLQPLGEPKELASFSNTTSEETYTYVSTSQSQEWLSLIFAVVQNDDVEWLVGLYDTELEEMWSMEFHQDAIDDYFVTDSGEVVVAGFLRKKNSDETLLRFAILDGEHEQAFSASEVLPELGNMEIVRYENGKIYCTGLLTGEKQDASSRWYSGIYSLVYDTRAKRVTKFEKRLFSKEDICDLCNVSHRARLKINTTDKLQFSSSLYDKEGTTVLFERTYNYLINGMFSHSEYVGILAYRIANDGSIQWHRVVLRDLQAPLGMPNRIRTVLVPAGDKYAVFYIDHPSNANLKEGATAITASLERSKLALMSLTLDRQGNCSRQLLEVPSKSAIIGTPHLLSDGSYLLILSRPFNSNLSFLKYE